MTNGVVYIHFGRWQNITSELLCNDCGYILTKAEPIVPSLTKHISLFNFTCNTTGSRHCEIYICLFTCARVNKRFEIYLCVHAHALMPEKKIRKNSSTPFKFHEISTGGIFNKFCAIININVKR